MCFSAKASFISSSLLAIIGIISFKETKKRSQYIFSFIPILFAVQQFSEWILWITLPDYQNSILVSFAKYAFIFFAFLIWPVYIPLSVLYLESDKTKYSYYNKVYIKIALAIGIIWTSVLSWYLYQYGAEVQALCSHIYYSLITPFNNNIYLGGFIYSLTTILPFYLTKQKIMWFFGTLLAISFFISYIFWSKFFISVWCFFAALLSISVILIIKWQNIKDSYLKVLDKYKN